MTVCFSGQALRGATISATQLPSRARQLLAGDDLDGYRELFELLESIEDPHRRHWTALRLIEAGLAAGASAPAARLPALNAALAGCALQLLEREPSEPRLLNHAGVVLHELWSVDAAEALFEAARRLDPQLEEVEGNLRELGERRRLLRDSAGRAPLRAALPELARRALAVAARAQPAEGLTLSLCMIVRDEEQMLPRCLAAVAGAVDEIVIVDTGSTDATIEIARSFGAHVIEREWTGSFAEARNTSFDAARGDWLMYLDADELLVREDIERLRALTGRTWREAFYLSETHHTGDADEGTALVQNALRVFRNRPGYRFEGRLHEQIAGSLPTYLPERFEATGVRIEHYGFLGVVRDAREKSRRNIELLELQQAESAPSPFLHFNLGSEYAAAGDAAAALVQFERSWELLRGREDRDSVQFTPALLSRLVKALRACGRPHDAFARAADGLERFPDFTELVLEQAFAAVALGQEDRAIALYERCIEMGDPPRRYTARVGCGTYLPRVHLAGLRRSRGELEQAIELLELCLCEHPEFVGAVLPYASARLADGMAPDAVVRELALLLGDPSPAARFMLGTALYEAGATSLAETQFRIVLRRQPRSARARVALGEALLAQRRYAEAAAEAARLPGEDPLATAACRTELFARIAGGDSDGLAAAQERARGAGMAPEELDLFRAWAELVTRGRTEIALDREAVSPLAVMLEALLRVQDFDSFEALLGLLERCPIGERERRGLLAEMYLRRGFVAAAGEEWMAVCRQQPDADALLGLARVATAGGMPREAGEFAAAALERDPDNEAAASLLVQAAAA
jgi:glycosyltransferase involved in cell wall biosynthesis/Flp pilus assembly protein TadD